MTDPNQSPAPRMPADASAPAGANLLGRLGRGFAIASLVMAALLYLLRPG